MNAFLDALNWALLAVTLSGMALALGSLSRRLGEALMVKKYYVLYYVSIALFWASAALIFLSYSDGQWALTSRLAFFAGALLMAGVTVRYWGWVMPEMLKPGK